MRASKGYGAIIVMCVASINLRQSYAFVHRPVVCGNKLLPQDSTLHRRAFLSAPGTRPALSRLQMAKKGASKRKKKKDPTSKAPRVVSGGGTSVADAEPVAAVEVGQTSGLDDLEDAGGPMMGNSGFGAGTDAVLQDGVPGIDSAREAKVAETLRKMGVQSSSDNPADPSTLDAKRAEIRTMSEKINSIFDLIPAEVQLGLERFFIVGFTLCLLFLVAVGLSIATEAYFKATTGELPQELDNFIVQNMQPYLTPSLVGTFGFSVCLGVLKIGQMGQESVLYKEDDDEEK